MITLEEAEADRNALLAREEALDNLEENASEGSDSVRPSWLHANHNVQARGPMRLSTKVIAKLPSFRITRRQAPSMSAKDPSFFNKLFSSRKLNRIGSDDGLSDASEETDILSQEQHKAEEEEKDEEPLPPMPKLGKPVNMELLVNRNTNAVKSMEILMGMVERDVHSALSVVSHIPVGGDFDRAAVTPEISKAIAQVKSAHGIQKRLEKHVVDVQAALNYRRSSLIMMNSNYQHVQVRKLEPIYVNEARTITIHKT